MITENISNEENSNEILGKDGTFNIVPMPISIKISDPITNEFLGEFKEKDGLLTFEGKTDAAGKVFVDFICETFKQRIEQLYVRDEGKSKLVDLLASALSVRKSVLEERIKRLEEGVREINLQLEFETYEDFEKKRDEASANIGHDV